MKAKEKRKARAYKVADTPYFKALKRAKGKLATHIETLVLAYSKGHDLYFIDQHGNKQVVAD